MASELQGIQQLLLAKKRAAKVSEARKRKNRRLTQAKEAAQAEIEQYRLQREKEFKAAAAVGSRGSCSSEVEKESQERMTVLQNYYEQNRDEDLDNLLAFVCDIRPEIRENFRING